MSLHERGVTGLNEVIWFHSGGAVECLCVGGGGE